MENQFDDWPDREDEIQGYDPVLKRLKYPQEHKIRKIIENNCIERVDQNTWICKPIQGYNKNTYTLKRIGSLVLCNCQGFQKKAKSGESCYCSHSSALRVIIEFWKSKHQIDSIEVLSTPINLLNSDSKGGKLNNQFPRDDGRTSFLRSC